MPEFDDFDPYYGEQSVRRPATTATPAATATPPVPAPAPPAPVTDEAQRSKWEGMGVGGGTVRAHWETDEDDQAETVRVVIDAPPPPPPPARKSNGSEALAHVAATEGALESPSDQAPFDLAAMHQQWPSLINQIWKNAIERAPFLSAQLVGVEGRCLIVQASSGALNFVNDEKRRAIRGRLIETLGRGADIRFIDDKTPYLPSAGTSASGAPAAPAIPARPPLPTADPVIQAGLRFFGGPIERLPDD
jgi:hypothetical protein